jgi:hypothetical protein
MEELIGGGPYELLTNQTSDRGIISSEARLFGLYLAGEHRHI